ncbi:MAG: aroE [Cereibacter sp.]|jgi:shikimate dehydrogenase|nr:aroE [Cereibacter sp.]
MMPITGATRLFAILADPIAQVRTPQGLNALMAERGTDGVMVPMHVGAAELTEVVRGLRQMRNFGGCIVTVPHKKAILGLVDEASPRAQAIGAANAVRREPDGRLVADMLDGLGFVEGLRGAGLPPAGRSVFLAGAGGAGNAIAFGLAEAGIARLTIHNRTEATARDLAARLRASFPSLPVAAGSDPSDHDLAVNATALGMKPGDPAPFDLLRLTPEMTVAEVIMAPEMTPMLSHAAATGCRIHKGAPMLAAQLGLMAAFLGMTR